MQVYLYGSHVTSWKNENGEELLHLSSKVLLHIYTIFHLITKRDIWFMINVSNFVRDDMASYEVQIDAKHLCISCYFSG